MPMPDVPIPGQQGGDPRFMRNKYLYGGAASDAMINALMDKGINPFGANPMVKMLLEAAPGLVNAFALQNTGAKTDDINALGGYPAMIGDFLKGAVGGGNVFSTLSDASRLLPSVAGQIGDYNRDVLSGRVTMDKLNPFMQLILSQSDRPGDIANIFSSLNSPLLGGGALGQAYQRSANAAAFGAGRAMFGGGLPEDEANRVTAESLAKDKSFWDFIYR